MNQVRRGAVSAVALAALVALAAIFAAPLAALPEATPVVMPGPLADFWLMWPKAGHEMQFEAGIKTHVAWRKQAGEGWSWSAYQPVVGSDLTYFVFRSGEHRWADFDAQQAWEATSKAGEAFQKDVAPHVERYEHYLAEEDYENSKWVEATDYKYFWVQEHQLKPGGSAEVREAVGKIHRGLQAGGWPLSYAISRGIGGEGTDLTLVFPYRSYAEMEDPKPGFMEVLTKGMGTAAAAQAALKQFDDNVEEMNTTIYAHRADLSTPN